MPSAILRHHKRELIGFASGIFLAIIFLSVPQLHHLLRNVDELGYLGMFIAGLMYGSGLTASMAVIIFIEAPAELNPFLVALIAGCGSAIYDLTIFHITRRQAQHGWLAAVLERVKAYRRIPSWVTLTAGVLILISPLPDELAAGLFGVNGGRARTFFLYSFVSNTGGVLLLNGAF